MTSYREYQGFRGTSRGRGNLWRGTDGRNNNATDQPQEPYGSTIDSFNSKALFVEEVAPTIQYVEYVASYSWLDGTSPVILVPGSPPAWAPPVENPQLQPDREDVFRDINAARHSSFPLEPVFRALEVMQPNFDQQSVDVVGCGSTIGNLLTFAGSQSKPFRFDVDVVGDTVLFVRKEKSPTELISDHRGYGHTFPEAYTALDSDVRKSCSHQRIVQYEFGGLKFLVRSETDGYLKEPALNVSTTPKLAESQSLDDVLGAFPLGPTFVDPGQELEVRLQGTKVPQSRIFDIKTRASSTEFNMEEIVPRLWVNQTSKFLIAYHKYGKFDNPKVEDVRSKVLEWEARNSNLLAKFHATVSRIVEAVRSSEDQQCEVSWSGQGPLLISKQVGQGRRALPADVMQLFDAPLEGL